MIRKHSSAPFTEIKRVWFRDRLRLMFTVLLGRPRPTFPDFVSSERQSESESDSVSYGHGAVTVFFTLTRDSTSEVPLTCSFK